MVFGLLFLAAVAVAALVFALERRGDPRLLERLYSPRPTPGARREDD